NLAKLHEQGELLEYNGIAISLSKVAITSVDSSTVYTNGSGSIVLEERDEQPIDIQVLQITAEAIDEARKSAEEHTQDAPSDAGTVPQALLADQVSDGNLRALIEAFIAGGDGITAGLVSVGNFQIPTEDKEALQRLGLNCPPIKTGPDGQI